MRSMSRINDDNCNCPLARAMEVLGEGWTLLVLREAFLGTRQFKDFERELGVARNILSTRLKKLVELGLLQRAPSPDDRRVVEYRLTDCARALLPVLVGLSQWAGEWLCDPAHPVRFTERSSGKEVQSVQVLSQAGEPLQARDVIMRASADANPAILARYRRLESA